MKKNFIIFFVCVNLMACATQPTQSLEKPKFTPESFTNNSRIIFRDVTIASYPIKIIKKTVISHSIAERYGDSINDSFNNVSHAQKASISSAFENETPPLSNEYHTQKTSQINLPDGTTYVPLTFPVPPPKEMMQKFHMQIGQTSS